MPDDGACSTWHAAGRAHKTRRDGVHSVSRMLQSPKAHSLATNFAGQWLQIRKLATAAPDPQRFTDFNDNLRTAMRTETEMYFDYIAAHDRSIRWSSSTPTTRL